MNNSTEKANTQVNKVNVTESDSQIITISQPKVSRVNVFSDEQLKVKNDKFKIDLDFKIDTN